MDKTLQRKLRDLGRAVFQAISESPDVSQAVEMIRAEGYTLSMQLNCKKGDSTIGIDSPYAERARLAGASVDASPVEEPGSEGPSGKGPGGEGPVKALPAHDPTFRIDGEDRSFLRSIGIDPTRRMRRRR